MRRLADFDAGDVNDGLAQFLSGVDNDLIAAPDNLYIGTLDLLTNEPIADSLDVGLFSESSFSVRLWLTRNPPSLSVRPS